jgi:hypothetical protein
MLVQNPISQNAIITGLRDVGKIVLLDALKPIAQNAGWLWTGNDMSESVSLTEERLARRIVVDLAALLSPIIVEEQLRSIGFNTKNHTVKRPLGFDDLWAIYEKTTGLTIDKLRIVLLTVWQLIEPAGVKGVVFAYDEAQNLADHAKKNEFPLSLLIDLFSGLQRATPCQFLLVLSGLPTLCPKLNEARTYTERMFHVLHLQRLSEDAAREAIIEPIRISSSPLGFTDETINTVIKLSAGYPFFIQFISKEVFDAWIGKIHQGLAASVPTQEIIEKLDQDFFSARWTRATDRQQEFMKIIATLHSSEDEFTVQEIVETSKKMLIKPFSQSHATQMLTALAEKGLIFRNRRGGYCFAVPLLSRFIARQKWAESSLKA